ncbi:MAG: hypothetical protein JWN95_1322 [Frankiales bacterium]|nr:hypothetical protein [Frankiales bacterium]
MTRLIAGLALVSVLLTACAQSSGSGQSPSAGRPPVSVALSCPSPILSRVTESNRTGGAVPDGVRITSVIRCRVGSPPVTARGAGGVIQERATGTPTALLAALRQPDQAAASNQVCPAIGQILPYVILVDSTGKGWLPWLPRNSCKLVQPGVTEALNALPFRLVRNTPAIR